MLSRHPAADAGYQRLTKFPYMTPSAIMNKMYFTTCMMIMQL